MKPKYNTTQVTIYIATQLAMGYALYRGVEGVRGAQNVFVFLSWLGCCMAVFASCSAEMQKAMVKNGKNRSVPASVALTVDAGFVITLVYFDWWWTALATLIATAANQNAWDEIDKLREKETANT